MLNSSADSLLTLINDILDFSKIEARKLTLDEVDFNLRDNLDETLKPLAVRAHQKGLELACQVAPDVPDELVGDPGRLRQIVVNLLGNAIKFTERGEVRVRVESQAPAEGKVCLHFAVADTGIGIPADKQRRTFEAFEQADGSTTRQYGGTGLGLAISSQVVEMMGGRICVESEVGQASTFRFTAWFGLGCAEVAPQPRLVTRHVAWEWRTKLHVLLAEDNAVNRALVLRLLEKRGHAVRAATNGRETLNVLERSGFRGFDLVLMDVQMPEMDGFEATAAIRAHEKATGAHLAIIAMTAHAMKGDRERCLAAGMDGYVSKPIRAQELWEAIARLVRTRTERVGEGGTKAQPTEVLDRQQVLACFEGNKQLLAESIGLFLDDCPKLLAAMREAVARQDAEALERTAHTLKGSLGYFAAGGALETAQRVETMGRNRDFHQAAQATMRLEKEIEHLRPALVNLGREVTL